MASATTFFDFKTKDKRGKSYPLSQHRGKVVLVINTASKCGFTPQLKGLEKLNNSISTKYADQFVMLAFPCNQFGGQEPDDETQSSCLLNYGVTFPVLAKTNVNPSESGKEEPVWEWMKKEKTFWGIQSVKWNFEKFLIGRDGQVVARWTSIGSPKSLQKAIEAELANGKVGES